MNDCSTSCNCGCANNASVFNSNGGNCCSWIWIILLLSCFGGGNGCGNGSFFSGNNGCGNNSCEWLIWILLISCFSGNSNGGFFNNNGCGCCNSCNNTFGNNNSCC